MAERFGYNTIKDAIVTLLGTTNVSDLNNGLTRDVQQVITVNPIPRPVIPDTKFPTVCVWLPLVEAEFEGASKRKINTANFQIHAWAYSQGSVDKANDEILKLVDNIEYILNSNVGIASIGSSRGYIKVAAIQIDYDTSQNGFIAHGYLQVKVTRVLN